MFEFMFGWRKASKCKKLIKKVGCRLNLLKNKRSYIVRQLRNDVAQLIKHGHYQTAFDRVDQIYKDECIVAVYELLALFCDFITLQFSYIRRNKDCPNDINEAISSLIFASARCGNLPELIQIRKLFSERYGERFETTALELLPGNLVNFQIIENLSITNVPNEAKYKLLEEITTSVQQNGPLALEFASEGHQQVYLQLQATNRNANQAIPATGNRFDFDHSGVDTDPSMIDPDDIDSSSENSTVNVPEEIVYLDDIVEFQSPLNSGKNEIDQRVFVFRSSAKTYEFNDFSIERSEHLRDGTEVTRRSTERPISSAIGCSGYRKRSPFYQNFKRTGDMGSRRDYYPRAMSMPCMRSTKCVEDNGVMRSNSLPVEPSPPHVHPKLPDYDELAAMFMALKKEHLQNHK